MTIMELAAQLGQAIKVDESVVKMEEAKAAYDANEELQKLILEYNMQQIALGEEYKKENVDRNIIAAIEAKLDEIYNSIIKSDDFLALSAAEERVNTLMQEVNAEITFQITGQRPCSHDCSSCGSDCGHAHHHH